MKLTIGKLCLEFDADEVGLGEETAPSGEVECEDLGVEEELDAELVELRGQAEDLRQSVARNGGELLAVRSRIVELERDVEALDGWRKMFAGHTPDTLQAEIVKRTSAADALTGLLLGATEVSASTPLEAAESLVREVTRLREQVETYRHPTKRKGF